MVIICNCTDVFIRDYIILFLHSSRKADIIDLYYQGKNVMSYKRRVLLMLLLLTYFSVVFFVMKKTGITCVFLYFLGVPCPGCGMTRALRSVLRFEFLQAFRYNPLIYCMPYVFAYIFIDFKNKKLHNLIISIIGIVKIAVHRWIQMRLFV